MGVPDLEQQLSSEQVAQYDGPRLFLERARAAKQKKVNGDL